MRFLPGVSFATLARRWLAAGLPALLLTACATLVPPLPEPQPADRPCIAWLNRLDALTDAEGVRDASAHRVPGFPFLRSDRLLASFSETAGQSAPAFEAWARRLAALDAGARRHELANLPEAALNRLDEGAAGDVQARTEACANGLLNRLLGDAPQQAALRERTAVPDDYATRLRALGLYPLTRWPFFAGVDRWQQRWSGWFQQTASLPDAAPGWTRTDPPEAAASAAELLALLNSLPRDALGLAQPDATTARRLLQAYAPVLEVLTRGAYDRFGPLRWGRTTAPEVDTETPWVYQRLEQTRWGDKTLLQLVYSVWFPERPASGAWDLLAGPLDGVVLRLTLDAQGRVVLFDSIHACGCYHLFVPTPALAERPAPGPGIEWAFVPTRLPPLEAGQRLRVRLSSGEHQVVGVDPAPAAPGPARYQLADDDSLRSLPLPGGGRRSAFGPDGIVAGSERGERWLFWPMGIANPGAMRQWGRQPTAFVGRRHFDGARLIEERFAPARPNQ